MGIADLTGAERAALLHTIATREGSGTQIAQWYECTIEELHAFVALNATALAGMRERHLAEEAPSADSVTPQQLDDLWITQKFERLRRYQDIADSLYISALDTPDATNLRELRAYMLAAANELGQLLHRGSGESGSGDTLNVDIQGIDIDNLR